MSSKRYDALDTASRTWSRVSHWPRVASKRSVDAMRSASSSPARVRVGHQAEGVGRGDHEVGLVGHQQLGVRVQDLGHQRGAGAGHAVDDEHGQAFCARMVTNRTAGVQP